MFITTETGRGGEKLFHWPYGCRCQRETGKRLLENTNIKRDDLRILWFFVISYRDIRDCGDIAWLWKGGCRLIVAIDSWSSRVDTRAAHLSYENPSRLYPEIAIVGVVYHVLGESTSLGRIYDFLIYYLCKDDCSELNPLRRGRHQIGNKTNYGKLDQLICRKYIVSPL